MNKEFGKKSSKETFIIDSALNKWRHDNKPSGQELQEDFYDWLPNKLRWIKN